MANEMLVQADTVQDENEKQEGTVTAVETQSTNETVSEKQSLNEAETQTVSNKTEENNKGDLSKKVCLTDVNVIKILNRKRELNTDHLTTLKESISKHGLIQPIVVTNDNVLIAGYHRLQAFKELNYSKIPTVIKNVDEMNAEILEIDENLIRQELTQLEKSEQLKRRKEIYEILNPNAKADTVKQSNLSKRNDFASGDKQEPQVQEKSFTQETAEKTGLSQRSIQQSVQIAENLSEEAKTKIKDTELEDNKTALLEIARTEAEKQAEKVTEILEKKEKKTKEPKKPKELPVEYKVDFVRKMVVVNGKWYNLPKEYNIDGNSYDSMVMVAKNMNGLLI